MTKRDEQRAACIEAMIASYRRKAHLSNMEKIIIEMFDSLHGIARVNPVEAANEMIDAGIKHRDTSQGGIGETFDIMSAAGDLTNPPEKKP